MGHLLIRKIMTLFKDQYVCGIKTLESKAIDIVYIFIYIFQENFQLTEYITVYYFYLLYTMQ